MLRALLAATLLLVTTLACTPGNDAQSHASPSATGPPAPVTAQPTLASAQPSAATPVPAVVDRLKGEVAQAARVTPAAVTVVSLEPMVWPDGCLGLGGPGVVCTQALVPGWLAVLRTPDGAEYRYRGVGDRFAPER